MVDARLPDGSRVNAIIPPLSLVGPCINIRKFSRVPFTADDLVSFGTMTPVMKALLQACVVGRLNVIISGGTGSGKTTTLNVLSSFIPNSERIVTIEDAAELQLQQEHVVTLESRPPNLESEGEITIRMLVRNALRMRPDRIIVGEVRGGEALDMLQAMNTGHDGSLSTAHTNSPRDTLARLETMVLMAGMDLPSRAVREQIASAMNLIVHQHRFSDGTRKITHISEIQGMEGDVIVLQDIFLYRQYGVDAEGRTVGEHLATGLRPKFLGLLESKGIHLSPEIFAPRRDK
jgi:pilus assembly protein CpaF